MGQLVIEIRKEFEDKASALTALGIVQENLSGVQGITLRANWHEGLP